MTNIELILNMLAEASTKDISEVGNPKDQRHQVVGEERIPMAKGMQRSQNGGEPAFQADILLEQPSPHRLRPLHCCCK